MADRAIGVVDACDCGAQEQSVWIVRDFDTGADLAEEVRARLHRRGIEADAVPLSILAPDIAQVVGVHRCAYVIASDENGELRRIAALARSRLVVLTENAAGWTWVESPLAAMRATWCGRGEIARTFPSAIGRVREIAFDSYLIVPNQPETGSLSIRLAELDADPEDRALPVGTSVSVRCLTDSLMVETIDRHGEPTAWHSSSVEIQQRTGVHRVFRDGLSVADLGWGMRIEHDRSALRLCPA